MESDVYVYQILTSIDVKRHILTSKDGPRTVRVTFVLKQAWSGHEKSQIIKWMPQLENMLKIQ